MPEWYELCRYCKREIDFSGAAITFGGTPQYEPFMEDWRGGLIEVAHAKCFAEAEGIDALLTAVQRNDLRQAGRL